MRAIAAQLARKQVGATELDQVLGWVGDLFGLDQTEQSMLAIFARWGKFDSWRELVHRSPGTAKRIFERLRDEHGFGGG